MSNFGVIVNSRSPLSLGPSTRKVALRKVVNRLMGILGGAKGGDDFTIFNSETATDTVHRAAGLWISASGSGTMSALVNGTQVDVTYATSDANTAGLMAAAINADATAKTFVSAHRRVAKMTFVSVVAGTTITFGNYVLTATAAATSKYGDFSISGNDTADALAFCNAFNALPGLASKAFAVNSAGVVYVALLEDRAAYTDEVLYVSATTVTVNNQLTEGAIVAVVAHSPGLIGNCCTLTASGTGASVLSLVSGKLGGGLGVDLESELILSSTK